MSVYDGSGGGDGGSVRCLVRVAVQATAVVSYATHEIHPNHRNEGEGGGFVLIVLPSL